MSKQTPSLGTIKRSWHTPQLFIIRGQDIAQGKATGPTEGGAKTLHHTETGASNKGPVANVGPS